MAGAYENKGKCISLEAAADHSSNQFKLMKVDSNGQAALCSVLGESVIGVLQDKPSVQGMAGEVMVGTGVTKVTLGATLAAGAAVTTSAAGIAVASGAGYTQTGVLLQGGVSGDKVAMILTPGGLVNVDAAVGRTVTLLSAGDYTSTGQYMPMEVDSAGKWVAQTTADGVVQGILQNAPDADENAIVMVSGVSQAVCGATIAIGAEVGIETGGELVVIGADDCGVGVTLEAGADGVASSILIQIGNVGHSHT